MNRVLEPGIRRSIEYLQHKAQVEGIEVQFHENAEAFGTAKIYRKNAQGFRASIEALETLRLELRNAD